MGWNLIWLNLIELNSHDHTVSVWTDPCIHCLLHTLSMRLRCCRLMVALQIACGLCSDRHHYPASQHLFSQCADLRWLLLIFLPFDVLCDITLVLLLWPPTDDDDDDDDVGGQVARLVGMTKSPQVRFLVLFLCRHQTSSVLCWRMTGTISGCCPNISGCVWIPSW